MGNLDFANARLLTCTTYKVERTVFFPHENESRKAAKRKGSWAHQQTDKITPWTIVSLSVVQGRKNSECSWRIMKVQNRPSSVWRPSLAGSLTCLLNTLGHHPELAKIPKSGTSFAGNLPESGTQIGSSAVGPPQFSIPTFQAGNMIDSVHSVAWATL